ncbi:IucA/IucC family protein [Micromonospora sp. CPCC 206060]|uniref:IucA/IucC family protein n=1 Tax=Micromonospora sp. CPCC 206060 TaxID=3122406 RepID=UPI002FF1E25C
MRTPPELTPQHWQRASATLAAKMIAELAFEQALTPEPVEPGTYQVTVAPQVTYRFTGRPLALGSWRVDPGSLTRCTADGTGPADPYRLLLDLHAGHRLDPAVTALTVGELTATLTADAHLLATGRPVAELADLPHLELEGHQGGHPWLIANKGRVGFSDPDRAAYAPEARPTMRLCWLAAHRSLATYHGVAGLDADALVARELDAATVTRFTGLLTAAGVDPADYVWLPVHRWQWDEVVVPLYAGQLATGLLVPLGEAPDRYRPQQSIRTFGNLDHPDRFDVKLPLSILNTMVYRGIPDELVRAAPPTTTWLHALRDADPFLRDECRLILPGEVAAVSVRHPVYTELPHAPYRYRQLLGAIWRQPVAAALAPGERARTLAALLHVDPAGRAFVAELVARSGLSAQRWLAALFAAVLPPLLHLLYQYGIGTNPHGENATVVYDHTDVPVRLAVKDFVDDLKLLHDDLPEYAGLPDQARAVLIRCDDDELRGSVVKSLLFGHFRHLAPLAAEQLDVPEEQFWALVREQVLGYRSRFPEPADRHRRFDLLAPTFPLVCLNRERLLPGGYHDRAERDAHFDVPAAPVVNPLHDPAVDR